MNSKTKKSHYALAMMVISRIIDDLETRGLYYRDKRGRPIFTLDQAMVSIMKGELVNLQAVHK